MPHPLHRVTAFEILGPHRLGVMFDDGSRQDIDFAPVLHGPLFGPLQDLTAFNGVVLDVEAATLVWPNGADFDPAALHDWPRVRDELAGRAREWAVKAAQKHAPA